MMQVLRTISCTGGSDVFLPSVMAIEVAKMQRFWYPVRTMAQRRGLFLWPAPTYGETCC